MKRRRIPAWARRVDEAPDSRLGMQDAAALSEPTYHCRKCDEHIVGWAAAEDHLMFVHAVSRDLAREAMVIERRKARERA